VADVARYNTWFVAQARSTLFDGIVGEYEYIVSTMATIAADWLHFADFCSDEFYGPDAKYREHIARFFVALSGGGEPTI